MRHNRNDIVPRRNSQLPEVRKLGRHGEKYTPEMCERVRLMAQEGMWPEEWCAEIGVTMSTLYAWADTHPEFEEAVIICWHLLQAYYARELRNGIKTENKTLPTLMKMMQRRFPWTWGEVSRSTQQHFERRNDPNPDAPPAQIEHMNDDQLRDEIRKLQERIADMENGT